MLGSASVWRAKSWWRSYEIKASTLNLSLWRTSCQPTMASMAPRTPTNPWIRIFMTTLRLPSQRAFNNAHLVFPWSQVRSSFSG